MFSISGHGRTRQKRNVRRRCIAEMILNSLLVKTDLIKVAVSSGSVAQLWEDDKTGMIDTGIDNKISYNTRQHDRTWS